MYTMKVFYYFLRKKPRRMGRVFGFPNSKTIAGAIPVKTGSFLTPKNQNVNQQPKNLKQRFLASLTR